jgi:hypothetical protein
MILIISDTKDGHTWAKALVETGNATEWEDCNAPFLGQSDQRVKEALIYLVNEGVMVHKYDYVWIMRLLNERYKKKDDLFFESIQSYRDYVATYMQLTAILMTKFEVKRNTMAGYISQWLANGSLLEVNGFIHASDKTALAF